MQLVSDMQPNVSVDAGPVKPTGVSYGGAGIIGVVRLYSYNIVGPPENDIIGHVNGKRQITAIVGCGWYERAVYPYIRAAAYCLKLNKYLPALI